LDKRFIALLEIGSRSQIGFATTLPVAVGAKRETSPDAQWCDSGTWKKEQPRRRGQNKEVQRPVKRQTEFAPNDMKRSRKAPAGEDGQKATVPKISQNAADRDHFYRCPACGELVDGRQREIVARHHRHVLFPQHSEPRGKSEPK
jgi:hypothetical protein